FDRRRAAAVFLARVAKEKDYPWNAELVRLIGELPPGQAGPVLRRLWSRAGLNDVILPVLARKPAEEDRERFLEGLASPQPATVRLSLSALEQLPEKKDGHTVLALVQALRRLPDGKEEQRAGEEIARHLKRL